MIKGGRKLALGFVFLGTSTALAVIIMFRQATPDWLGLSAFVAAQASGILSLMVGFRAEYQANGGKAPAAPAGVQP